eukprot:scaffold201584_cov26-Tisochrysis_lutea.AAC.2
MFAFQRTCATAAQQAEPLYSIPCAGAPSHAGWRTCSRMRGCVADAIAAGRGGGRVQSRG